MEVIDNIKTTKERPSKNHKRESMEKKLKTAGSELQLRWSKLGDWLAFPSVEHRLNSLQGLQLRSLYRVHR
jgi:hypothetical protein